MRITIIIIEEIINYQANNKFFMCFRILGTKIELLEVLFSSVEIKNISRKAFFRTIRVCFKNTHVERIHFEQ